MEIKDYVNSTEEERQEMVAEKERFELAKKLLDWIIVAPSNAGGPGEWLQRWFVGSKKGERLNELKAHHFNVLIRDTPPVNLYRVGKY